MNLLDKLDLKNASGVQLTPIDYNDDFQDESNRFNKVIIINKDIIRDLEAPAGENNLTTNSRAVRKSDNNFQKRKKP